MKKVELWETSSGDLYDTKEEAIESEKISLEVHLEQNEEFKERMKKICSPHCAIGVTRTMINHRHEVFQALTRLLEVEKEFIKQHIGEEKELPCWRH